MKSFKNTWPGSEDDEYFKLFAEQTSELVSSYSWSSYRAKATSTPFKASELNSLALQVKSGELTRPTISHAIEEYIEALSCDKAIRRICDLKGISLDLITPKSDASADKLIVLTRLMMEAIAPEYIDYCKKEVIKCCTDGKSKNNLRTYLKLLIPALINTGVPRQWIYEQVQHQFYTSNITECSANVIIEFFKSLSGNSGNFCFLFRTNERFAKYLRDRNEAINVYISEDEVPKEFAEHLSVLPRTSGKDAYVFMPYKKGADPYSVARAFNKWISLLRSMLYLADVGHKGFTPKSVLCHKEGDKDAFKMYLNDFFNPGKERPLEQGGAVKISENLHRYAISISRSRDESSSQRFFSSLSAVSLAAKAHQPDSRLLAIWAGFEGLLPAPIDKSNPRIVHFERFITPCVASDYIPRIFSEFRHDCLELNRQGVSDLINSEFGPVGELENFIEIFYANKGAKGSFCAAIKSSPLLLNRALELDMLANSASKIVDIRASHIRRVKWQVNRIYRERNAIVHRASRTTVVQNLSEHAYNYFRSAITALEAVFTRYNVADTDASLELIRQQMEELSRELLRIQQSSETYADSSACAKSVLELTLKRRLRAV